MQRTRRRAPAAKWFMVDTGVSLWISRQRFRLQGDWILCLWFWGAYDFYFQLIFVKKRRWIMPWYALDGQKKGKTRIYLLESCLVGILSIKGGLQILSKRKLLFAWPQKMHI